MDRDVWLLLVGALISLITTFSLQLLQFVISDYQKNKGKVNIYVKSVYSKINGKPWGIDNTSDGQVLLIPLWIELQNTKNKKEIIRDVNLYLYKDNKKIKSMVQVFHSTTQDDTDWYGDEGRYSFLLDSESIVRYNLNFTIKKRDINDEFDKIKIGYL